MDCRPGCAACCIAPSISSPLPGLPQGKPAGMPCPQLDQALRCRLFGQPERQTVCECERSSDSNLGQALQLYNGPLVHGKLRGENNRLRQLAASGKSDREIIEELYLAAYARPPKPEEAQKLVEYVAAAEDKRLALEDAYWSVLNSKEFVFNH